MTRSDHAALCRCGACPASRSVSRRALQLLALIAMVPVVFVLGLWAIVRLAAGSR